MTSQHAELSKSKLLARAECDFMINKYSKLLRGLPRHKDRLQTTLTVVFREKKKGGGLHWEVFRQTIFVRNQVKMLSYFSNLAISIVFCPS